MMTRGTKQFVDLFDRAQVFSATPGQNGWTIADTSSSGTDRKSTRLNSSH